MRYIPSLPPLPSVKEEDAPRPLGAVRPVKPVGPHGRVLQGIQNFGPKASAGAAAGGPAAVRLEKRTTGDRREGSRRQQRGQSFLDTRSGVERRRKKRRDNDIVTALDEEV